MKRILALLLGLGTALILCACTGSTTTSATVDMAELQTAMLEAGTFPTMRSVTGDDDMAAQNFTYFSKLDYDKVENYLLSFSNTGTPDEFAVIAIKDPDDVQEAAVSLNEHKDSRCNIFRQYSPEQLRMAETGIVFTKDQYAVLIISENPQAIREAFEQQLG